MIYVPLLKCTLCDYTGERGDRAENNYFRLVLRTHSLCFLKAYLVVFSVNVIYGRREKLYGVRTVVWKIMRVLKDTSYSLVSN